MLAGYHLGGRLGGSAPNGWSSDDERWEYKTPISLYERPSSRSNTSTIVIFFNARQPTGNQEPSAAALVSAVLVSTRRRPAPVLSTRPSILPLVAYCARSEPPRIFEASTYATHHATLCAGWFPWRPFISSFLNFWSSTLGLLAEAFTSALLTCEGNLASF